MVALAEMHQLLHDHALLCFDLLEDALLSAGNKLEESHLVQPRYGVHVEPQMLVSYLLVLEWDLSAEYNISLVHLLQQLPQNSACFQLSVSLLLDRVL